MKRTESFYNALFEHFADIIDTGNAVYGVKCTRGNDDITVNEFDVVDGYWPNWLWYNIDSEKSPYVMVSYMPNDGGDVKFKVFGAKYEVYHNGFIDWNDGIELVMNGWS